MTFRAARPIRTLLVAALLFVNGDPALSIELTDGQRIAVADWGAIRTDVTRVGALPDGSDHLVATYFFENPDSGEDERVGVAPDPPLRTDPFLIVRTGSHLDLAIGNRTYQRLPRFAEWQVFEVRPGAFVQEVLARAADLEANLAEAGGSRDASICRIDSIDHNTQLMVVRCEGIQRAVDVVYRREGFESAWRIDERKTLEAAGLATHEEPGDSVAGGDALIRVAGAYAISEPGELATDLDAADAYGQTALMRAVRAKDDRAVKALLAAGAQPGLRNRKGFSALCFALRRSQNSHTRIVRVLLENGAPIAAAEFEGAVSSRNPESVRLLFEFGGSFDRASVEGEAILLRAQQSGESRIDAILRDHPVIGPAMRARDRTHERERESELAAIAAFIAPYSLVFALFLSSVPFLLALASWTWHRKLSVHLMTTATLSAAAIYLAYFPRDIRDALAEFRFFGERTTNLPYLLSAAAVLVMLVTAAMIAPIVFIGLDRTEKTTRHWAHAVLAGALCLGFFALLTLHNLERVDLIDEAHQRVVEILRSFPHAASSRVAALAGDS